MKKQKLLFKQVIKEARELAKKENRTITVYRTTSGEITLDATSDTYSYITPHM